MPVHGKTKQHTNQDVRIKLTPVGNTEVSTMKVKLLKNFSMLIRSTSIAKKRVYLYSFGHDKVNYELIEISYIWMIKKWIEYSILTVLY